MPNNWDDLEAELEATRADLEAAAAGVSIDSTGITYTGPDQIRLPGGVSAPGTYLEQASAKVAEFTGPITPTKVAVAGGVAVATGAAVLLFRRKFVIFPRR